MRFKPNTVTTVAMAKSISTTKKRRGRPQTKGVGRQIGERWHEDELAAIDDWRRTQKDLPSQGEAIRRLVRIGLSAAKRR